MHKNIERLKIPLLAAAASLGLIACADAKESSQYEPRLMRSVELPAYGGTFDDPTFVLNYYEDPSGNTLVLEHQPTKIGDPGSFLPVIAGLVRCKGNELVMYTTEDGPSLTFDETVLLGDTNKWCENENLGVKQATEIVSHLHIG